MKDTVRVLSLIWLYLAAVTAVDSEYFKQVSVKRKLHLLWRGRNASSNLRCAAQCVSDTSCAAHVYDATTSSCQGYRSAIQREIVQGTRAKDGYVLYYLQRHVLETTTGALPETQTHRTADIRETTTGSPPETQTHRTAGTVGINQNCNRSTKCHVPHSSCSRGICKCVPGYYHKKTKNICSRRTVGINQNCNRSTKCYVLKSRCSRGICKCFPGYYYKKTKNSCLRSARGNKKNRPSFQPLSYPGSRGTKERRSSFKQRGFPGGVAGSRGTKERGSLYQSRGYPGTVGIEQVCSWNSQCRVVNSVCHKDSCKCTPGFSYNIREQTCVRKCKWYGTTASIYMGLGIDGHNDKYLKAHSHWTCMSMCASETSFRCLSFDYKPSEGCQLSSYGYLDVREKYRETDATGWIFGTRNCANYPPL